MEQTTKRATKKALEQFEMDNSISMESVLNLVDNLYPGKYAYCDEFYRTIISEAYKRYDIITPEQLIEVIKELAGKKLVKYSHEYIKEMELNNQLNQLRSKIVSAMQSQSQVKASDFEEWTDELREFMVSHVTWSSCYNDDGSYSLGRAFFNQFRNYEFFNQQVPFHSYTSDDGTDVLFTHSRRDMSANSGCLSVIIMFIASAMTISLLIIL